MSVDSIPNEKLTGLPSINYIFECGHAGCIDGGYEHRGESGENWRTGTGKAVNIVLRISCFFSFPIFCVSVCLLLRLFRRILFSRLLAVLSSRLI